MLRIANLSVAYESPAGRQQVLGDINLEIAAGETCAIIGPSGCGKSTLLKVLAGIIKDFSGSVTIDGEPLTPRTRAIGFIPQNYGLLPWKNVYHNVLLGLKIKNKIADGYRKNLADLLDQLGLTGLERRYPGQLSGGQQQRVSLARSFLLQPNLLLMDEPFSALDAMTREDVQDIFLHTWRQHRVSTVLVTHQVEEAVYLGRRIVLMSALPGKISQVIENPLFGVKNARSLESFGHLCVEVRKLIKEAWQK